MPTTKYVTRICKVEIPDDRDMVRKHVLEDVVNIEDTDVIMASDNAIAVWLTVQNEVGNYTKNVEVLDVDVTDECPPLFEE